MEYRRHLLACGAAIQQHSPHSTMPQPDAAAPDVERMATMAPQTAAQGVQAPSSRPKVKVITEGLEHFEGNLGTCRRPHGDDRRRGRPRRSGACDDEQAQQRLCCQQRRRHRRAERQQLPRLRVRRRLDVGWLPPPRLQARRLLQSGFHVSSM